MRSIIDINRSQFGGVGGGVGVGSGSSGSSGSAEVFDLGTELKSSLDRDLPKRERAFHSVMP
jgi:hypothetical protein